MQARLQLWRGLARRKLSSDLSVMVHTVQKATREKELLFSICIWIWLPNVFPPFKIFICCLLSTYYVSWHAHGGHGSTMPLPPYFALCISPIWLFFYSKPVIVSKLFFWVLGVILASWTEVWVTWGPTTCNWCLNLEGSLVGLSLYAVGSALTPVS